MRIEELVQTNLREQARALRRRLPARALEECAQLVEVSPSRLARILGITRKPKRRYSLKAGEKIWRVADLRRYVSRFVGHAKANEFLKTPCLELRGEVPLNLARLWIGACWVREVVAQRAHERTGVTA